MLSQSPLCLTESTALVPAVVAIVVVVVVIVVVVIFVVMVGVNCHYYYKMPNFGLCLVLPSCGGPTTQTSPTRIVVYRGCGRYG